MLSGVYIKLRLGKGKIKSILQSNSSVSFLIAIIQILALISAACLVLIAVLMV